MPRVIEALSEPGTTLNEDCWGHAEGAVWVMDGATGVWPRQRLSPTSDAAWLVQQVDQALRALHDPLHEAAVVLREALAAVGARARKLCDLDAIAPVELPSASFVAARRRGDTLELANLGDCTILWRSGASGARRFGSSGVAQLDAALAEALTAHRANGLTLAQAREAVMDLVRSHRAMMNHPDGYWILDLSGAGVPHLQTTFVDASSTIEVLLMSDGFYRLVDVFGRYDDDALMDAAIAGGLTPLLAELRGLEALDKSCESYSRGKTCDDATAVLLHFD